MNWKRAPELIEYLLMYPLILPKLMKKLIYSENIFFGVIFSLLESLPLL